MKISVVALKASVLAEMRKRIESGRDDPAVPHRRVKVALQNHRGVKELKIRNVEGAQMELQV